MSYAVHSLFYTLQGEGLRAGRPAVFVRFAGCNLWSGRERDRMAAICRFCDTEFIGVAGHGGGRFARADELAAAVAAAWPGGGSPYVVCTGGEPALQIDSPLVRALRARGFEVAVETNGTLTLPTEVDWVCVSPKAGTELAVTRGDELKLVYPQPDPGAEPERFEGMAYDHFLLQPLDGPERDRATEEAVAYCLAHPHWRLSLQLHKYLGIP